MLNVSHLKGKRSKTAVARATSSTNSLHSVIFLLDVLLFELKNIYITEESSFI